MTAGSRAQARFGLCQDIDGVVAAMLERALKVMGTAMGNVQLIDWATKPSLEIAAQRGFEEEFLETFRSVSATSPSACGRALVTRDMIIIDVNRRAKWTSDRHPKPTPLAQASAVGCRRSAEPRRSAARSRRPHHRRGPIKLCS